MVFEEKGDALITLNLGTDQMNGMEAGFAITDNIALYSSFNSFEISKHDKSSNFLEDFIWDNELILFKNFNNNIYGAVNFGAGFGELNVNNPYYYLTLNRQFIQPTIGKTILENFKIAFSLRFTQLDYKLTPTADLLSEYDMNIMQQYFRFGEIGKKKFYLYEPAMTIGWNFEFFNLRIQLSGVKDFTESNFYYVPISMTTSLSLNLNKLFFNPTDKTKKLRWTL
ncbi:MAG: hypothetical protein Q7U47_08240 [Paludibacter sp.]|nr:hypothetical protein [Paludibacter sp.]